MSNVDLTPVVDRLNQLLLAVNSNTAIVTSIQTLMGAIMSDQSHLDTQVAAVSQQLTALQSALTDTDSQLSQLATEVAALKAANPAVDFSTLDALVNNVAATVRQAQSVDTHAQADTAAAAPAPTTGS